MFDGAIQTLEKPHEPFRDVERSGLRLLKNLIVGSSFFEDGKIEADIADTDAKFYDEQLGKSGLAGVPGVIPWWVGVSYSAPPSKSSL